MAGKNKVLPGIAGKVAMKSVCSFLCLPKETNQRKGPRVPGPAEGGIPCAPRCCRGFANSLRSNSANPLFGSLSGARLRANGRLFSPFVLPRLADGGGKRRGNCLRAKPEFFRVPPPARSKGSPQGQDWLGCLFLVSSFGHAKEEKENSKKASHFPGISGRTKKIWGKVQEERRKAEAQGLLLLFDP